MVKFSRRTINEYRHLFAPITADNVVEFIYIGKLEDLDEWFPKPHSNES